MLWTNRELISFVADTEIMYAEEMENIEQAGLEDGTVF